MSEIDLKIPYEGVRKEFKTAEDFQDFCKKYPEKVEGLTSTRLNKLYHVVGCRISKPKKNDGKITLIKDYYFDPIDKKKQSDDLENRLDAVEDLVKQAIKEFNARISAIETYLSK